MLHALAPYWSYILAPFGLAGMIMTGKKNRWGWALSIATQVLRLTYGVQTKQWGFLPGSAAYMFVYIRNFILWKPKVQTDDERPAA